MKLISLLVGAALFITTSAVAAGTAFDVMDVNGHPG